MTIYIQNGKHKSSKTASDKAPTVREILEDWRKDGANS
jgi:hypothetical protein